MTSRTPPPTNIPSYDGINPENSNAHFNNEVNSHSRNQSANGNNKTTSTKAVENRPVNRGYRPPQSDNFGALFGIEYYHYPVNKREDKKENKKGLEYKGNTESVGEVEADMAYNGKKFEELEWKNKLHSAKIHDLERELKHVRMENNTIRGQYDQEPSPRNSQQYGQNGTQQNGTQAHQRGYGSDFDPYQQNQANSGYPGANGMNQRIAEETNAKRVYKNDQYNRAHHRGEKDGEVYWGFNKFYNPQYSTSYRREHVPYVTQQEEKEEEWMKKRQEEENLLMKDKPKNYDYTVPYQNLFPPRDLNKYFHDSKYMERLPTPRDDSYYFDRKAPVGENPGTGLSTYERAYIDPYHRQKTQQQAGGIYFIRFHSSGSKTACTSLDLQQSIIHSSGGRILGKSRKHQVVVLEGDAEWRHSKSNHGQGSYVEDTVVAIWFPSKNKAFEFFSNTFRNDFKEQGFPTPHGWEGHFIPLKLPMLFASLDTVLIVELLNAGRYETSRIDMFEEGARDTVKRMIPNSLPLVSAAYKDKAPFRPGPFFKDRSVVYISMFSSVSDACEAWRSVISRSLSENGLTGPANVSAFSLIDHKIDEE